MKYEARLNMVQAIIKHAGNTLDALASLVTLFDTTPTAGRAAAVKQANGKLYAAAVSLHSDTSNAMRQLAFHVRTLPYVSAAGHAFAVDGGSKRGQVTLVTCITAGSNSYAVVTAPDGDTAHVTVAATFTGSGSLDRAYAAYRAHREGSQYVPKLKGKHAVTLDGAHVNAALVTVDGYINSKGSKRGAFEVYRANSNGTRKVNSK